MRNVTVVVLALLLVTALPMSAAAQGGEGPPEDPGPGSEGPQDNSTRPGGPAGNGSQDRGHADRAPRPSTGENITYPYVVESGTLRMVLHEDHIANVTIGNTPLFSTLTVPGLHPIQEVTQRGDRVSIQGDQSRLDANTGGRTNLVARSAEDRLSAELAPGVDAENAERGITLRHLGVIATLQGQELILSQGTVQATDRLSITGGTLQEDQPPAWSHPKPQSADQGLPIEVEGRYLAFTLAPSGLENITVHGMPIGSIEANVTNLTTYQHVPGVLHIQADGLQVDGRDAPKTMLRVEADGLFSDLPDDLELPSGARVDVSYTTGQVLIEVQPPAGTLSSRSAPLPAPAQVDRAPGSAPGLTARTQGAQLNLSAAQPQRISAHFQGQLNDSAGNVGMDLSLVRALLVKDLDGDGQVDIGEPAMADTALTGGASTVEDGTLRSTFPLWSGNLTVVSEIGASAVKITYKVQDLNAPPGSLFVLESQATAPPGMHLKPTPQGVSVRNGSLSANYSSAGPVVVDGESAWAQQSILVQPDGTVHLLVTYPAGDDIEHDPTLSIQTFGASAVSAAIAATPYAVVVGALAALALVGGSVYARRRRRP